jgi:leucyl aminopeptidase
MSLSLACWPQGLAAFRQNTQIDAWVVGVWQPTKGATRPNVWAQAVDAWPSEGLAGWLQWTLAGAPWFRARLGDTLALPTYGKLPVGTVWLVGLGKPEAWAPDKLRRAGASLVRAAQKRQQATLAWLLEPEPNDADMQAAGRCLAEGITLGQYQFNKYKQAFSATAPAAEDDIDDEAATPEPPPVDVTQVWVLPPQLLDDAMAPAPGNLLQGLHWGQVVAQQVNVARNWVNDSANVVTPIFLAEEAQALAQRYPQWLACQTYDLPWARETGMGAFVQVAKGSNEPAQFIHLRYQPPQPPEKTVALVGKGITFDSGGLSLKPAGSMETMKLDMAGGAAVLATMGAIARLADETGSVLPFAVDAYVPACENMPSGHAGRPGDVIRSLSGKTIEINNTDAEGRLVLADALTWAQRQSPPPDEIIDLATLTGACVVALGKAAAGLMGSDDGLLARLRDAGEAAGERLWHLPLLEAYQGFLKSDVADLINSGAKGEAGASAGGMFLKSFIEGKRPWAHLDIAGPAYISKEQPETPKGGTGFGVRTLVYYLYMVQ